MGEDVEAVVVPDDDRISRGVGGCDDKLAARRIGRVVEGSLHPTVRVVEHHLGGVRQTSILRVSLSTRVI